MPISAPSSMNASGLPTGRKYATPSATVHTTRLAEDRLARAVPPGEPAQQQRAAERHELHHQDRLDLHACDRFSCLSAYDAGHRDDRLDAVVVDEVRDRGTQSVSGNARSCRSVCHSCRNPSVSTEPRASPATAGRLLQPAQRHRREQPPTTRPADTMLQPGRRRPSTWPSESSNVHATRLSASSSAAADVPDRPADRSTPGRGRPAPAICGRNEL